MEEFFVNLVKRIHFFGVNDFVNNKEGDFLIKGMFCLTRKVGHEAFFMVFFYFIYYRLNFNEKLKR